MIEGRKRGRPRVKPPKVTLASLAERVDRITKSTDRIIECNDRITKLLIIIRSIYSL